MFFNKKLIPLIFLILLVILKTNSGPTNKVLVAPLHIPIPLNSVHAPILVYHYVEYVTDERDTIRKSLNILPYIFIRQIETLKNAGYTFITASELIDIMDGITHAPKKPVLITFDDGYRDFYTDVFPILKKYNIRATAYIISGFLDKLNYMFTSQLEEIAKSGLVEIGAHTVHHYSLEGLNLETAKYEIEESKKNLEEIINKPVVSFAYPDGSFDDQAIKLVREAGFKSAVTTREGFEVNQNNKYSIYRLHPGHKIDNFLLNFLEQK